MTELHRARSYLVLRRLNRVAAISDNHYRNSVDEILEPLAKFLG